MAFVANGTTTVGEVIDAQVDFLLNGLYREKQPRKGVLQRELVANKAARAAIEMVREHLKEVWCADAETRFRDVKVPVDKPWIGVK